MHEKKGFPAETVDGETVAIVNKSLDSNTMRETLTDDQGREYTREINGADKRLIPLDSADVAPEAIETIEEDELPVVPAEPIEDDLTSDTGEDV